MIRSTVLFASISILVAGMLTPAALAQCCGAPKTAASTTESASVSPAGSGSPAALAVLAASMASVGAEPVNKVCPIKGNEVDKESPTRLFKGVTIGFCCPGCEGKWDKKTDEEKMALLAKHAPEAVTAINAPAALAPAYIGQDKRVGAGTLQSNPALAAARGYLAACAKADAAALNALFLDSGRATVSENASDEGTWETYRDHHLLPELKEMPDFKMTLTKEDMQTFGTTTIVRHIGSFTVPDPNHKELTKKYLAAVTYVVVDEGGTQKIAHLHWSSRPERKAEPTVQAAGKTVNEICPMTGDKVNEFHTREFNGLTVGFCDGDCALRWGGLTEEVRTKKLADAIAGTTAKTPHGAQPDDGHHHEHK
jgi:hypothetical protein